MLSTAAPAVSSARSARLAHAHAQDVRGYSKTLAEQGFLLTHWEVMRDLWMDSMKSSPYMEAYELANMDLGTASAAYRFFELHVLKPMAGAIAEMEGVYQDDTNAKLVRM